MSKLNPRKNKCWDCKHGLCFSEEEVHRVTSTPITDQNPTVTEFGSEFSLDNEEDEEMGPLEQIVKQEHSRAICFWRPGGDGQGYPSMVSDVDKCNRYEKDTGRRINE